MPLKKPRSKKTFLRAMKSLEISKEVKNILAEIATEIEGAWFDGLLELRTDVLATLILVEQELKEHDVEYHHVTSPEVKAAVQRCIKQLK